MRETTGTIRARTVVLQIVLAVGSFLAVAAGIRAAMPGPPDFEVTAKLDYFRRHASEFDGLFIGSSVVFRHFVPEVIDARLQERGHPLHTFNMGGPGMGGHETDYILRQVLAMPGQRLKYVFIEPSGWKATIHQENLTTNRTVDWHTPRQTLSAVRGSTLLDGPALERLEVALAHLKLGCWRYCNYGQGPRFARPWIAKTARPPLTLDEIASNHGYQALEDPDDDNFRRRRQALLDNLDQYRARVRDLIVRADARGDIDRINVEAHQSQLEAIHAAGAGPIHVVSPVTILMPAANALDHAGLIAVLLTFHHPDRYPSLYEVDHRFDMNHLSREGAREFSLIFADAFADHLDRQAGQ